MNETRKSVRLQPDKIEPPSEQKFAHEYESPVARFSQLPKVTREHLERMREEDWKRLEEAMKFYETAKTVGKFNLMLIGGIVGLFIATVGLGETIKTAIKWFRP